MKKFFKKVVSETGLKVGDILLRINDINDTTFNTVVLIIGFELVADDCLEIKCLSLKSNYYDDKTFLYYDFWISDLNAKMDCILTNGIGYIKLKDAKPDLISGYRWSS